VKLNASDFKTALSLQDLGDGLYHAKLHRGYAQGLVRIDDVTEDLIKQLETIIKPEAPVLITRRESENDIKSLKSSARTSSLLNVETGEPSGDSVPLPVSTGSPAAHVKQASRTKRITYYTSRIKVVVASHGPLLHQSVIRLYSFMLKNSRQFEDFYDIPHDKLVEIGLSLEV